MNLINQIILLMKNLDGLEEEVVDVEDLDVDVDTEIHTILIEDGFGINNI